MANPLDLLKQKTLSNIQNTASRLFNQGAQFIQQNPTPAVYANQQFQQKVAQPIASGLKNAGQAYVQAVPAALKLSPPAQLANAYQNFKTNANPMQNLQTQGMNAVKAAPLVFGAAGGVNMVRQGVLGAAKTVLPNALLGGGISKFTGNSFLQGVGQGIGAAPQIGGVTQFSNPLINKTVGKLAGNVKNPLLNNIASRVATGALNIPEGAVINSALGRPTYGLGEAAMDFGTGALFGGGKTANAKGFDWGRNSTSKWEIEDINDLDGVTDFLRTRNLKPEQIKEADTIVTSLARGYLPKSKIEKLATDYGRNSTGFLKAMVTELHKSLKNQEGMGAIKMGIVDESTKGVQSNLLRTQQGKGSQITSDLSQPYSANAKQVTGLPEGQKARISSQGNQPLDDIIAEGRSQIKTGEYKTDKRSIKQAFDDFYTQWVDRYNPIVQKSRQAKNVLKAQGAELRPEYDPEFLVRRLTGAGGIADTRFQNELKPVLDQVDKLKIDKLDLDTYLAHKRMAGFGQAGRDIYGSDPVKSQQIVQALEQKYGQEIKGISDQLYQYQNKGFQEMVNAGFISPENAQVIKQQNPDYSPLYRAMDEVNDYLGLPTRKTMQGSQPIQKIKGSKRQIESPLESIIGNTFSQRAAIEKNRVAKSIAGLQAINPDMGFEKAAKSGPDTITVWSNGQKEYWKVGNEIADVAKGANEESMNLILKLLQKPASLLRQGATGRNPEFMLPNIIRDQLDAGISSKYGYIPFVDWISGMKSYLTDDDIYKKWENSGAKIDLGELSGKKSIQKMFTEKNTKKNVFQWLSAGLDKFGEFSEVPTRIGLFKKAYQKTGNDLLSVMESRDATVDFARMGSKMKVANSIIPFLNVGVQGFDKLIRAVKDNPGKVAVVAGIYGAVPQIATSLWNLQQFPQEYAEIPQYEKDSNFVIVKGRTPSGTVDYITIPKGNIVPAIANPVQSFLDYSYNVNKQSFGEMATNLLSEMLPVLSAGSNPKEVALKTIGSNIPQAVKPIAENLLNKSFYKYDAKKQESKEIVPYYLKEKPAFEQKYDFTPQMYQKIGAVLNVSPLQVQNAMEGYLAGYSKIPSQIIEIASKTARGDEVNPNDKTLMRRFFKQTLPVKNKEPAPEVKTPALMQRVFGEAKASSQPEPSTDLQAVVQQNAKDSKALREYKDYLTGEMKMDNAEEYFSKEYGVSPEQLDLRIIKSLNTQEQATQVYDLMKTNLTQEKFVNYVKDGLLTDAIAKEFLTTEKITKEQHDILKKLIDEVQTGKKAVPKVGGVKKAKKISLPKFKKLSGIKFSKPKKIKLYKPKQYKYKKLKV